MENIINELKNIDYSGIVAEYIFEHIANKAIPKLKTLLKTFRRTFNEEPILVSSEDEIINQIIHNIKVSQNWCNVVSFRDSKSSKKLSEIFVQLDFYLTPKRVHLDLGQEERIPLKKILKFENNNFIIVGGPGAGKTTLMKYVTKCLFENNEYFKKKFTCPVVIRLRDINSNFHNKYNISESLYYTLIEQFSIQIKYPISNDEDKRLLQLNDYYSIVKRIVSDFIDDMNILLILDGFDEISNVELKKNIANEIRELSLSLNSSKFILTSRTGEFEFEIENATTYEICSLTDVQIRSFINRWIKNRIKSQDLYNQIKNSPFNDTVIRPLNIAHLCAIYERYNKIPERPKSVYRKIIYLLLEEWDSQRSIERVSNYANFPSDRKFEFLSKLAFVLTTDFEKSVFSKEDLDLAYRKIYSDFELPINQVKTVVDEIESHSGLFIQSGFNRFEFSHKSIQEYLSAEYIAKSPVLYFNYKSIVEIPSEIAIATAISSNPNLFFSTVIVSILNSNSIDSNFFIPYVDRLLIEKPDFNRQASLACAIAYLHTLLVDEPRKLKQMYDLHKNNIQVLKSAKLEKVLKSIEMIYLVKGSFHKLLYHHENIAKSFSNLHNYYSQGSENLNYLTSNRITLDNYPKDKLFEIKKRASILGLNNMPETLLLDGYMICLFNNLN